MVEANSASSAENFDFYDALNLSRDASSEDIRSSFRELSRLYHPDKHGGSDGGAASAFVRVNRAYKVLGDEVLRKFYDQYGPVGLRLAEDLTDDESSGIAQVAGTLSLPEDRLRNLEERVQGLIRRHQELRIQRLLALTGSFTLAAFAGPPGHYSAFLRRKYRLQYSAVTQTVHICLGGPVRMSLGCAMHVQGNDGLGVSKLTVGASSPLGSLATLRAGVSLAGGMPECDVALSRSASHGCLVHQKLSSSADGTTMMLSAQPWLSKTLRGNISGAYGEDPYLSIGLLRRSASSGHKVSAQLSFHPTGNMELGGIIKYKPDARFSVKLQPAITSRGFALQATCCKSSRDKLTKLHWNIAIHLQGVSLKLTLFRSGLRFALPLQLWPESAGPLPARELGLALALWAMPPLVLRCMRAIWVSLLKSLVGTDGKQVAESAALWAAAEVDAKKVVAREQQRLMADEAERRRCVEAAQQGLEILAGWYGDPGAVLAAARQQRSSASAETAFSAASPHSQATTAVGTMGAGHAAIINVADALMAKVRKSRLHLSDASKSTLLGFCDPRPHSAFANSSEGALVLFIRYRFGCVEHERTFGDADVVVLP
eukprot:TRINITY_DN49873_c0_g1_i1.p1 TRINITY_DN49873_c0_g1~~TRINITY_DN49873_c0_g1_i1.p1  ORF type:complete len:600 (-),score=83.50 TRINITY_DN49873_c0_g1_i1:331-2130(-)